MKFRVQQALKRSMHKQSTLGIEKLAFRQKKVDKEESTASREKLKSNRVGGQVEPESNKTEQEVAALSVPQTVSRPLDPTQRAWYPAAVPSYEALPIPPPGSDQHTLDIQQRQAFNLNTYRGPAPPVRYLSGQGFTPINGRGALLPRGQFAPIKLPSEDSTRSCGSGPTVQKFTPLVSACHGIPPSRVDKHHRYLKAQASSEPASARLQWTGAVLPTRNRQNVFPEAKPPKSKKEEGDKKCDVPTTRFKTKHIKKPNNSPLIHLSAPVPTPPYLTLAHVDPLSLSRPQRLLLVLDLNGTLLYRPSASQRFTPRPSLETFLKYVFANHSVLIWSSAIPTNVTGICARVFNLEQRQRLLGEWARDSCGLTAAQYKERVQVYKRLDRIWDNQTLQLSHPGFSDGEKWGQHNTLLIDDSVLKASAQPFNHVEVPEFVKGEGEREGDGKNVLAQVVYVFSKS